MNVSFISLGCDKNRVNTEQMMALCLQAGHTVQEDCSGSDVVVINTCGFIESAKTEAIETILETAQYKQTGSMKGLVVTGCLVQRYADEMRKELPEIDVLCGTGSYDNIVDAANAALKGQQAAYMADMTAAALDGGRNRLTPSYTAYFKIAEGCSNTCAYCIIPKLRGRYRSREMASLLEEARALSEAGVKELIVIAQDITKYGMDLPEHNRLLPDLLRELCKLDFTWIRLHYLYPDQITDELIETIKTEEKVCNYLDIPIQHASDAVLKRMGRRTNNKEIRGLIAKLRKEIPDIALRTTLISGFPGETEEDHEILMQFVDDMEFDRLGVFAYSPEEDTPAFSFENQVPEEVKQDRRDEIMELQQEIAFEKSETMKGRTLEVMIEGKVADENAYVGRTYMDSPNVDGLIFVNTGLSLMSGDFLKVRVTGASEYDLIGEAEDEFTE